MALNLRPHHILCAIGFQGRGYDAPFTANMMRVVMGVLRAPGGEKEPILITGQADVICAPCPKRVGLGCATQDRVDRLDQAHAAALGLEIGGQLTWGEALARVREKITPDDLETICAGCQWLDQGMCRSAVHRLRSDPSGDAAVA